MTPLLSSGQGFSFGTITVGQMPTGNTGVTFRQGGVHPVQFHGGDVESQSGRVTTNRFFTRLCRALVPNFGGPSLAGISRRKVAAERVVAPVQGRVFERVEGPAQWFGSVRAVATGTELPVGVRMPTRSQGATGSRLRKSEVVKSMVTSLRDIVVAGASNGISYGVAGAIHLTSSAVKQACATWRRPVQRKLRKAKPLDESPRVPLSEGVGPAETSGSRLRKRGKATRAAEKLVRTVVGDFRNLSEGPIAGGETSHGFVTSWIRRYFGESAKALEVRQVGLQVETGTDAEVDVWVLLHLGGGAEELLVSLRLLMLACAFMSFRPRNQGSLLLLRSKLAQYGKMIGLTPEDLSIVCHGTVVAAMIIPEVEKSAVKAFEGNRGDEIVAWSERLTAGVLYRSDRWWRRLMAGGLSWFSLAGVGSILGFLGVKCLLFLFAMLFVWQPWTFFWWIWIYGLITGGVAAIPVWVYWSAGLLLLSRLAWALRPSPRGAVLASA